MHAPIPIARSLISIITLGSRGDVQPYVALALGLRAAGHRVRVATHESFRAFVEGHGLDFSPVAGDPRAILATRAADEWLASGRRRKMLGFLREMRALAPTLIDETLADYERAAAGADLVVFSVVGVASWHVAEGLGIPAVAAFLQPASRTGAFPAVGVPQEMRLGAAFNRATHRVAEAALSVPFRGRVHRWRRDSLGMGRAPVSAPYDALAAGRTPTLYAFSPRVVPRPADWAPEIHVTGYWFLDEPVSYEPPPELARFLADGPPPVYVGYGSMTPRSAEGLTRLALDALERAGRRGVLLSGWGSLGAGDLPPWATAVSDVPHAWLFPRCAAVVHHGGAGTTGAGLRAGVPSVVVPLGFDQPFWGHRIAALGVGPKAVPRRGLTVARLARAIAEATTDGAMRERAASLGEAIRAEDGVGNAVAVVGRVLGARG